MANPIDESEKSARTVTIASKLPYDLIMRVGQFHKTAELVMGGGVREIDQFRHDLSKGEHIIKGLRGTPFDRPVRGLHVESGFALTPNIPKPFWDCWLHLNKDTPMVVNKLVFASHSTDVIEGRTRELENLVTGLEPLDADSPDKTKKPGDGFGKKVDKWDGR